MENNEEETVDANSLKYDYSTAYGAKGSLTIGSYGSMAPTYGNITINSNNSGPYVYSAAPTIYTTNNTGNSLHVKGPAEFEGDIMVKGRSLEKMFQKIEDRLAILQEPDPEKLEKFAALKKAYEHYKTLERLIGED
jgi:hypothetical protein